MAKLTYSFDLHNPDDAHLIRVHSAALGSWSALVEIDGWLRGKVKYGDLEEGVHDALVEVRNELREILFRRGVDIDE